MKFYREKRCVVCREEVESGEPYYAMYQGAVHIECLTAYAKWFFESALEEE